MFEINPRTSFAKSFKATFNSQYEIVKEYIEKEYQYLDGDWQEPSVEKEEEYVEIQDIKNGSVNKLHKSIFNTIFRPVCKTYQFKDYIEMKKFIDKNKIEIFNIYQTENGVELDVVVE